MGRDRWVCEEEEERRPVSIHLASKGSTAAEMDTGEGPRARSGEEASSPAQIDGGGSARVVLARKG
jgi:hypothetical protein